MKSHMKTISSRSVAVVGQPRNTFDLECWAHTEGHYSQALFHLEYWKYRFPHPSVNLVLGDCQDKELDEVVTQYRYPIFARGGQVTERILAVIVIEKEL